jgi:endo-1,4-beta-xylanase
MVSFPTLFVAFTAALGVTALPTAAEEGSSVQLHDARAVSLQSRTASSTGTSGGYYYSFWTDGGATVTYTNGALGKYTVTWGTGGNFVGGKGWATGSAR